jgi:hypothetical protein
VSSTFRIDYVEAALISLLNAKLPAAYGTELGNAGRPVAVDIESLGDDDFNEDGRLVLQPPSVRVRFNFGDYNNLRDNQRLTYQSTPQFDVICFESSLRSKADQRRQSLVLVGVVTDQLAGARLNLSDGSKTMPVTIGRVSLVEDDYGPVDQCFSIAIGIEGIAQFSGANANPN